MSRFNDTTAMLAEDARRRVAALAEASEGEAATLIASIATDLGRVPHGEYEDSLVVSMLADEVLRLRDRVAKLEALAGK